MTTDPGTVPKSAVPLDYEVSDTKNKYRICLKCDSFKPERTHHCEYIASSLLRAMLPSNVDNSRVQARYAIDA